MFEPFTHCTHCGSEDFDEGPRGGASINVFCITCRAGFNVVINPPIGRFETEFTRLFGYALKLDQVKLLHEIPDRT